MNKKTSILFCVLLLVAAQPVTGQIVFGQPASGSPQFVYSHWTFSTDSIETTASQFYIPVTGFVPIQDNLEAHIYLASSSNSVDYEDYESSVSGFSDVRIQVNKSLSDDHVLISGGLNLPTGKTKLNLEEEWLVVPVLSQDFLEFPLRRLGEGFGFNVLAGGATTLGEVQLGGGVAYRFLGKYKPYDGSGDYDSGDILSVNAGLDVARGKMQWTANAVYTTYSADKTDGRKTFKQSPQIALNASGTYQTEPHSITGWISWVGRGENTFYDSTEAVFDEGKLYGDEFAAGAQAVLELAGDWNFMPSVKWRTIAENDFTIGSASIVSFGGAVGRQFNESISARLGFRYFTGSVDGDLIDLNGYQLSGGLVASF